MNSLENILAFAFVLFCLFLKRTSWLLFSFCLSLVTQEILTLYIFQEFIWELTYDNGSIKSSGKQTNYVVERVKQMISRRTMKVDDYLTAYSSI